MSSPGCAKNQVARDGVDGVVVAALETAVGVDREGGGGPPQASAVTIKTRPSVRLRFIGSLLNVLAFALSIRRARIKRVNQRVVVGRAVFPM